MLVIASCSPVKKTSKSTLPQVTALSGGQKMAFDEHFFAALSAKYGGETESAMMSFRKCLALDPTNTAVNFELSQIYLKLNYLQDAVKSAQMVVEVDPTNRWYLENAAQVYQAAKRNEQSAEVYEQLLKKYPNELAYYYELGEVYLQAKNAPKAIETYERLEQVIGFENNLAEQLFKLYEYQKMNVKAEAKLKELMNKNPNEIRYISMLAGFYDNQGETQKSIDVYEKLKTDYPNDPYVKLALYEYYDALGKTTLAFENLQEAFKSSQVNIDAKVAILVRLMERTEQDASVKAEVFKLLDIMTLTHPDDPKTWALYGDYLNNDKKLEPARKMFLKSIDIDPSKYPVWSQVLFIDSDLNDIPAILEHTKACIELFPNQVLPYYFNGVANLQKEDFQKAIDMLALSRDLAYGMPELEVQILANLGDAYYQIRNFQKAWISYDQSLRLKPSNDYVLNNYAYFLSVENEDLEKALSMSKQTVDRNPKSATYLDTYGWILYKMKRYDEAVEYLKNAAKYDDSKSGEIFEHLGDALYAAGKTEEALVQWQAAKLHGGASNKIDQKIQTKQLIE